MTESTIQMLCDTCGQKVRFTVSQIGQAAKCPKCGTLLKLRDQPSETVSDITTTAASIMHPDQLLAVRVIAGTVVVALVIGCFGFVWEMWRTKQRVSSAHVVHAQLEAAARKREAGRQHTTETSSSTPSIEVAQGNDTPLMDHPTPGTPAVAPTPVEQLRAFAIETDKLYAYVEDALSRPLTPEETGQIGREIAKQEDLLAAQSKQFQPPSVRIRAGAHGFALSMWMERNPRKLAEMRAYVANLQKERDQYLATLAR